MNDQFFTQYIENKSAPQQSKSNSQQYNPQLQQQYNQQQVQQQQYNPQLQQYNQQNSQQFQQQYEDFNIPKSMIFYEEDIFIKPKKNKNSGAIVLLIFVILIIIIIAFFIRNNSENSENSENSFQSFNPLENISMEDILPQPTRIKTDPLQVIMDPSPIGQMYHSEQVDSIVTGNLYQEVNNLRPVYTQRTAFGLPKWDTQYASANGQYGYHAPSGQLSEYNSSGASGDVGVTKGPMQVSSTHSINIGPVVFPTDFDDGMPEEWNLPSTPMLSYYESHIPTEDYYGPEGPTPYSLKGFNMPFEPDHEPHLN